MTKAQIVRKITTDTGIYRKDVATVIDAFLETIKDLMKSGKHIELRHFGSFKLKVREARISRNPRTNETFDVPKRVVPAFKFSKEFKVAVSKSVDPSFLKK